MSVLIEAWSIIVRNDTLERKYPGGVAKYAADTPNTTFCTDGLLTRVGFLDSDDVDVLLSTLSEYGLIYISGNKCVDIAVINQHTGLEAECDWIEGGTVGSGFGAVWLRGTPPRGLSTPAGWKPDPSLQFVSESDAPDRIVPVGVVGSVEAAHDKKSGDLVYTSRAYESPALRPPASRSFRSFSNLVLFVGVPLLSILGLLAAGFTGLATGAVTAFLLSVHINGLSVPGGADRTIFRIGSVLSVALTVLGAVLGQWQLGWAGALAGTIVGMILNRVMMLLFGR